MADTIVRRLIHAYNAFTNRDPTDRYRYRDIGNVTTYRPDKTVLSTTSVSSVVTPIYNRLAIDVASLDFKHVKLDENDRYSETVDSHLNKALTVEANIDQTGRSLIQDAAMSMFDEGCIAIVPIDTTLNPDTTGGYDIYTLRVGQIVEWYPKHISVRLYNENTGLHEDITVPKNIAAIVENPLYAVMNEPNSTLKRLIRKLSLLDAVDEQSASGKLDIIIQLPYVIKTDTKKQQADQRRKEIEMQLAGSKYGIAYTDGTEKITQLNRPAENNLMNQVEYLTSMLHSQLGLTDAVMNGTADEKEMLNYYNRTIEPIANAIAEEMHRKYLTKTARTQKQAITYFRDAFKLVPVEQLADIADKFTRNEILSSNDVRGIIGFIPSKDPRADELKNKNLNDPERSENKTEKTEEGS